MPASTDRRIQQAGAGFRILEASAGFRLLDTASAWVSAIDALGPVAWWRQGEASGTVAVDSRGNHDGTYINSPTLGVTGLIAADPNAAVTYLRASTQWISVPHQGPEIDVADNFSFLVAYKRTATSTFQTLTNFGTNAFNVAFNATGLELGQSSVGISAVSTAAAFLDTTSKHLLVVTKAGATNRIILDGVDVTGTVTNKTMTASTEDIRLFWDGGSPNESFDGTGDEVALFNYAITVANALDLWTKMLSVPYFNPMPPLLAQ